MLKVKNQKAIRRLAARNFRASGMRNIVAILAIMLTAILFTALFTIGGSMILSMQQSTMRQVGTSAHGGYKFLTQGQYDTLKKDPELKDISYNIIVGNGENPELKKTYTEIRYTEPKAAKWSFSMPTTGTLPKEKYDLATTTQVLDALGIPHQLGQTVPLDFSVNGVAYHQDFTLCGFWKGDEVMAANEIFVSRAYSDEVAPVITTPLYEEKNLDPTNPYAGSINPTFWFSNSWDLEAKVEALSGRCGFDPKLVNSGVNWAYASSSVDLRTIALVGGLLVLVGVSGYLIIYNVFYISVSRDVQFYGLLKTVGTTKRQIKRIVRYQALLLCGTGIPLGLVLGWFCGKVLLPFAGKITNYEHFAVSFDPRIFVVAALFTLLTVFISCIRPARLAAKVSPVEAIHWIGVSVSQKRIEKKGKRLSSRTFAGANIRRERKKAVLVVVSLSLSLILLNATVTIVKGFDMDKYLKEEAVTDFTLGDAALISKHNLEDPEVISADIVADVTSQPWVKGYGCVYMRESQHKISGALAKKAEAYMADQADTPWGKEALQGLKKHQMESHIYGVDPYLWPELEIHDPIADWDTFGTGDYVIVSSFWDDGTDRYYEPGDKVTIDFGNGKQKEYTVFAIGDLPYPLGPEHGHSLDIYFTLPGAEYQAQIGPVGGMKLAFDVTDGSINEAETWVNSYCDASSTLDYISLNTFREQFDNVKKTYAVVGGSLSLILALIGLLNFINAMVTSVYARRRELAMLQSIGMTEKQQRHMLLWEGLIYALLTFVFTLTVGNLICYGFVLLMAGQIWFFTYHFTLLPILFCLPFLLLIAVAVPRVCGRKMAKQSVVERLRQVD